MDARKNQEGGSEDLTMEIHRKLSTFMTPELILGSKLTLVPVDHRDLRLLLSPGSATSTHLESRVQSKVLMLTLM